MEMGSLLFKVGKFLTNEYKLQKGVRTDVEFLQKELPCMHTALCKVDEVPPEQLDEQVKVWACELRDLFYHIDDVVDTFMVRVDQDSNLIRKGWTRHQIANKIQDIKARVQEVADRRDRNRVDDVVANPAAATTVDPRLSALHIKVTDLVGIDEAGDELIKRLTEGDDASKQQLKIVSVVGFGGMGKTTIANQVYQKLKKQFDCGAFVSISRSPDTKKVLRDILLDVDEKKCKNPTFALWDERRLINELKKSLEHKRYLVVIDDIWDMSVWTNMIRCALPDNNLENRIIATTRDLDVANQLGGAYKLQPLSDANSKKLFYGRLFGGECLDNQLREVSDKILRKCGGVPLAIVTIASLLNSKMKNTREWNKVHDSIGCGHLDGPGMKDMRWILSLSYYSLPTHLRTCLLYMSIFPEDYKIKKDQLISLWIAEGFIQRGQQGETPYELGEYYFNGLINRSLIQPVDIDIDGRVDACRVHDMVLDLIRSLSKEKNFVTVLDGAEQNTSTQSNVRRLSIQNTSDVTASLDAIREPQKLRSLAVFSSPAINSKLPRFCFLRVLELGGCDVGEARHLNLGNLLHLRYLGLRETCIQQLPSTLVQLRQLMCLRVDFTTRLPDRMGRLASLEVLQGINANESPGFVKELSKLTGLRELEIGLARYGTDGDSLEEDLAESLRNLPKIHTLDIHAFQGCLDHFGKLWVPPQHLVCFSFRGVGFFSRMPACIGKNFLHLPDLSSLEIHVKRLRQEDMQILARLPALCSLEIRGGRGGRLIISADGFRCLREFTCWGQTPMFQQGVMPKVQRVFFTLLVHKIKDDGNDGFETGLGNLLSLEDVEVYLQCPKARAEEVKEAEAALRHAADVHPNSPTLQIRRFGEQYLRDSDIRRATDGEVEEAEAALRHAADVNPNKPTLDLSEEILGSPFIWDEGQAVPPALQIRRHGDTWEEESESAAQALPRIPPRDWKRRAVPLVLVVLPLDLLFLLSGLIVNAIQAVLFVSIRPFSKSLYRRINRFLAEVLWLQLVWLVDWWAGVKIQLHADEETYQSMGKEHALVISNHRSDIDWLIGWILAQRSGCLGSTLAVMKKTSKFLTVIGWSMWFAEYLFLERNWTKDEKTLKWGLQRLKDFPRPFWLALFVEGTRFTPAELLAAQEYAASQGLPAPRNVLLPRTKGFVSAVSIMRDFVPAIYDTTVIIPKDSPQPTMLRILKGQSSVVHIRMKRHAMSEMPKSAEDVSKWCKDIFVAKDALLDKHLATDTFDEEIRPIGRPVKSLLVTLFWACLLLYGAIEFFKCTQLLSTWKGVGFTVAGLALVTGVMHVFIMFSQSERSSSARAARNRVKED